MSARELVQQRRPEILHALCSGGSPEPLEGILDVLLAKEEITWEDYQNVQVPGRALNSSGRQLLDLVYAKGAGTCELFLAALRRVLPERQTEGFTVSGHAAASNTEEESCSTWTRTLLTQRPSLVEKLQSCITAAVQTLLEAGHLSSAESEEVQLSVFTPAQQARRVLDRIASKGESAAEHLLQLIQQREASGSSQIQDKFISSKEFLTYRKKLSSSVSAQSCFLGTYGGTGHMPLDRIFTEVQLESAHRRPLVLEDVVSVVDAVNEEADTVLVSGVAGSGKSTLLQKLHLGWSQGAALGQFLLVFPFSCRRLNSEQREVSVQELLFQHCCWPDRGQKEIFQFILDHPQLVLFTFDGLDELKQSLSDDLRLCCPTQRAPMHVLLSNLITGSLMKGVWKVVTSRPDAVDPNLKQHLRKEVFLEGFSLVGIDSFVRRHHSDPAAAAKVLESLNANTALLSLCHNPVLCWIVSQCHTELLGHGEGSPQTLTDVYLMILQHFFQHKCPVKSSTGPGWLREHLQSILHLSKLAFEGIAASCYVFTTTNLQMCDVTENEICLGFLIQSKNITQTHSICYEFLHVTIQCFFAALYVILSAHIERSYISRLFSVWNTTEKDPPSMCFGSCVPSPNKHGPTLKDLSSAERPNLQIMAAFVSGLLSQRHRDLLQPCSPNTHTVEKKGRQVASCLSEGMQRHFRLIPRPVPGEKKSMHAMPQFVWLIKCIYEMQERGIASDTMSKLEVDHLKLTYCSIGPVECTALAFVLQHLQKPVGLDLDNNSVGDVGVEQLLPCMHICNSMYLRNNNITDDGIRKLLAKGVQCPTFQKIALFNNRLTDACTRHFSHFLENKQNFLSLRLGNNNITADGAKQLAQGLKLNRSLKFLGLWGNRIGDAGAEALACALENSTSLVWLSLVGNGVGSLGACALSKIIRNSPSLEDLWLTDNCITKTGVDILVQALNGNIHMKSVWLRNNNLSLEEIEELKTYESRLVF